MSIERFNRSIAVRDLILWLAGYDPASSPKLSAGTGAASAADTDGSLRVSTDGIPEYRMDAGWKGVRTDLTEKVTRSTVSDAAVVSAAQLAGGVLYQSASGGNVSMTTRTGTQIAGDLPSMRIGDARRIYCASNHASNTSTLSPGTDVTAVGSGAVTQTGGNFLLIKTAATTFDLVRVG
jgi:hypothetical protein